MQLKPEQIEACLTSLFRETTRVLDIRVLGETAEDRDIKTYGYGVPVRIDYETVSRGRQSAVLHTMTPGPFGHEHMADRAQILLWQYHAFNSLPSHVRSLDVGSLDRAGNLTSTGDAEEFYLLTEYAGGRPYALDLERLQKTNKAEEEDLARADLLCSYLADIHQTRSNQPDLYVRRIRELVGHGECVMGLADSFPRDSMITPQLLADLEHRFIEWRWRLKPLMHRLRRVHGDFHPWNILFGSTGDFHVLDRSRGEFGEPADDVSCLTVNYLFFSLCRCGRLEGALEQLFRRFWDRYLERTGDSEMLRVVPPFFAFRGLVLANPVWYPNVGEPVRKKILAFILAMLDGGDFNPEKVNAYCGA